MATTRPRAVAVRIAPLAPDALYCSPMRRAIQTARPIGIACGLEPIIIPEIHERRMGPLSGMTLAEGWPAYTAAMDRWKAGDLDAAHEGGESYARSATASSPRSSPWQSSIGARRSWSSRMES